MFFASLFLVEKCSVFRLMKKHKFSVVSLLERSKSILVNSKFIFTCIIQFGVLIFLWRASRDAIVLATAVVLQMIPLLSALYQLPVCFMDDL